MKVRFIAPAKRELIGASRFYEKRVSGLGGAFLDEVEHGIALIKQYPHASPEAYTRGVRRARLRQFPYGIVYRVENQMIVVFAVAHLKRRPKYWLRRIGRFWG